VTKSSDVESGGSQWAERILELEGYELSLRSGGVARRRGSRVGTRVIITAVGTKMAQMWVEHVEILKRCITATGSALIVR